MVWYILNMPHISAKKLENDVFRQIHHRFIQMVVDVKDRKASTSFLSEFFTPTEKIMLAKRLTTVFMLASGCSFLTIERTLKVSPTTIAFFAEKLETGEFDYLKNFFTKAKNKKAFWDDLEALLQCGLPPRGRGRWKWFYDMRRD